MFSVILYATFGGLFLILSSFWLTFFARRIYLLIRYRKGVAIHILDEESGFIYRQYYYHYQTEICKFKFLILINISEVSGTFIELIKSNLGTFGYQNSMNISAHTKGLEYCVQVNNSMLFQFHFSESTIPELTILEATGHSLEIIVITLIVCLMLYLIKRIKEIKHSIVNNKTKLYLITVLFSPLLIISFASVRSLIIMSNLLFFFAIGISLYLVIKVFKQLLSTLLQQAYQHLAQYGSNKHELRRYKYFKYTMTFILNGYFILLFATILTKFPPIFTSIFFYGKCYFPLSLIPQYKPINLSDRAIEDFIKIMKLVYTVSKVFSCIGIFIVLFPILILTVFMWLNIFYKFFGKKRTNQYRYNIETLNKRLI